MSPRCVAIYYNTVSFPRVSGDEPLFADAFSLDEWFSPRERG